MSFFHTHKWELVGKTYSNPRTGMKAQYMDSADFRWLTMCYLGFTTYLFKCSDQDCDAFRKEECAGQETSISKEEK